MAFEGKNISETLQKHFNQKADDIGEKIMTLSKRIRAHYTEFANALDNAPITDAQRTVIEQHATGTFMLQDDLHPTLGTKLAHPMNDALAKTGNWIINHDYAETSDVFESLVHMAQVIKAQTHNYDLFLGQNMPPAMRETLDMANTNLLPAINTLIADIETAEGLNRNDVPPRDNTRGWEHIHVIPAEEYNAT